MNPPPHLPRALAFLLAQGVTAGGPGNGTITIQNVIAEVSTWVFNQPLPPLMLIAVMVGGQPGHIYTPRIRVMGPNNQQLGRAQAADMPFTTQIERVNLMMPVKQISAEPIVTEPGTYTFEMLVEDQVVARTPLKIVRVPQPPQLPPGIVLPPQG